MKHQNKAIVVGVLLLGCLIIGAWFGLHRRTPEETMVPPTAINAPKVSPQRPSSPVSATANILPRPKAFLTTRYPPVTDEEKALWDWWNTMTKLDPAFEWKMPVNFFGKVIDQFGQPVEGANISVVVSEIGGTPTRKVSSDKSGSFSLVGLIGKRISVAVLKEGYMSTRSSSRSFEYAEFFNEKFHVPDPENPVKFTLHKVAAAQSMYVYRVKENVSFFGPPLIIDAKNGKVGSLGDFAFSVHLESAVEKIMPGYSIEVVALSNAALMRTEEDFPILAPDSGYGSSLQIRQAAIVGNYQREQNFKFYAKTRDGGFSLVVVTMYLDTSKKQGNFSISIYRTAKGSRELEVDYNKVINP